jgi:membrane fusion protein (multidrug efflux system)
MKLNWLAKGLVILSLLVLQSGAQAQQATLVATEPVKSITFHDQLTLVGQTEARAYSRIVAEVSGRVISIDAPEGNPVKKGQALVSIDPSTSSFNQQAKMAEETEAKVQADLARTNLKRVEELYQQKLVPNTTLDSAKAWVEVADARHARLQAERKRLDLDLESITDRIITTSGSAQLVLCLLHGRVQTLTIDWQVDANAE